MAHDEKRKQTLERQCRNHAEVDRGDGIRMVPQESSPTLRRRSTAFDHVFRDRRLGDVEAKLEQFAVDPWGTPQRVLLAHLLDKIAQLSLNFRPSLLTARLPAPIGSKPCSMPPQDGVRLNHAGHSGQAWPEPRQRYHHCSVAAS